jgi:cyclopropane-fatty-acyl-phospholipid synthase
LQRAASSSPVRLAPAAPLRRALRHALPARPFNLRFWDGSLLPATSTPAPTFELRSPSAIAHLVRAPSRLGLGRAYVEGSLDADDLDAAFGVVSTFELPPLGTSDRLRLLAAVMLVLPGSPVPRIPAIELALSGERHSAARDAAAVRYHYDAGNEFFGLFLDASMTYSCALFSRGARTLEEAQRAKLELVAQKLGLRAGQRVLDVGCGWGSFAIYAAREHGASVLGITLSAPQAQLARRLVREAGVDDRVEIRVADYRSLARNGGPRASGPSEDASGNASPGAPSPGEDASGNATLRHDRADGDGPRTGGLDGERFDAIASIGMVEHVGESQIDEYMSVLASLLRPGGKLLNHGIAALHDVQQASSDEFTNRYVFPDGEPLALSRIIAASERAGLVSEHVEGFQRDYAVTLSHWAERLDARLEDAVRVAGPERTRVWRLFLRAARMGFEADDTAVYQVLARRPSPR